MQKITTAAGVSHALVAATAKTLCGKRVPGRTAGTNIRGITCGSCKRSLRKRH